MEKTMTKTEEIELLKKLFDGKGYFADEFCNSFEQMKANILNDFSLLNGTEFDDKIIELKDRLNEQKKKHENHLREWYVEVLKEGVLEDKIFQEIGQDELILLKYDNGISLNSGDIEHMVNKLRK